jgi:hypothetical protein
MSVTVNPPKTPVTKGSRGVASATMPNVCKMPGPPAPFVLTALPNVGKSGDSPKGYTKNVKVGGQPVAIRGASFTSTGDAASKGTGGGLVSTNTHGPTTFAGPGSRDVKFEGKNVQLLGDPMLNNCNPAGRMPNSATMVGLMQKSGLVALLGDEYCPLCKKEHGEAGRLAETADTQGDADLLTEAATRAVAKAKPVRAQEIADAQRNEEALAQQALNTLRVALEEQLAGARAAGAVDGVAKIERRIAGLKPRIKQPNLADISLGTMLGIIRCKDGNVYAGTSSAQIKEVGDEMPKGWHTPIHTATLLDKRPKAFPNQLERFRTHVANKATFARQWDILLDKVQQFGNKKLTAPHYPPGRCAAQQVMVLALEHGGLPVGLTERWFQSENPAATVEVLVRDSPTAHPRLGAFGGNTAVPPCGTCEVILTMLMCPNEREPECQHRAPTLGVCRCT